MRCFVYCRLSRDSDESTSLERQEADCRRHADAQGWEVVEVFKEIVSAYSGARRPELERLVSRLGEVDVVVAWKVDRLARSTRNLLHLVDTFTEAGVQAQFATENHDFESTSGRMMLTLLSAFAEQEAATTGQRIRSAQGHLTSLGRWTGGPRPFGHSSEKLPDGTTRLICHPTEADAIREQVDLLLAGRTTLTGVANAWNEDGLLASLGGRWTQSTVRRALQRQSLMGWTIYQGEPVLGGDGRPLVNDEAVVLDQATWTQLQERLDEGKGRSRRRTSAERSLLVGVAFCDECGQKLHANNTTRGDGQPRLRYRCSAYLDPRASRECPGNYVAGEALEQHVVSEFLRVARHKRLLVPVNSTSVVALQAHLDRVQAELDHATRQAILAKTDTRRAIAEELANEAEAQLVQLQAALGNLQETGGYEELDETLGDLWEQDSEIGRRRLILQSCMRLYVSRAGKRAPKLDLGRVRIEWLSIMSTAVMMEYGTRLDDPLDN